MPGVLPNTKFTVSKGIYVPEFYAKPIKITTNYDVLQTDYVLLVSTSTGPINIDLDVNSPFIEGKILYIKDIDGQATANPISIVSANVDGNASYSLDTNYQGIQIIYYGGDWFILTKNR